MQHILPCISSFMHMDFLFVNNTIDPYREINRLQQSEEKVTFIFTELDSSFFYMTFEDVKHLNGSNSSELPWKKTVAVAQDLPFSEMLHQMNHTDTLLIIDSNKQPVGYVTSKLLLKELYQCYTYLKAYFETTLETTDASISVIDEQMNTVVWTKGAEQIFSIQQESIIGKPITDYFQNDMLQVIKTVHTGESVYRQLHQPRPDLFVLINTNPIRLNNEIVGAVAAETDITSQVRLNQELFNATTKVQHLEQEMAKLKPSSDPFHLIKGTSPIIKQTKERIKMVAQTDVTALILGESGVGKELFARAIHDINKSSSAPFVAINCGAIPPALFESEFFGYEKGAFSGADQKGKKGKVDLAKGGTLFLDEIGELPLDMQVKLLRLLQEKKYFPVGGTKQLEADFRIIAATNRNLEEMVKEGKFREDLYYRLNVVTINIPPLRDRKEDVIELTHSFLYEFSVRYNKVIESIPQHIMHHLVNYDWPGNVRELRNIIERLVVFSKDGTISREDLPFSDKFLSLNHSPQTDTSTILYDHHSQHLNNNSNDVVLQKEIDMHERKIIEKAIELENGNKLAAAKRLGVSRATLYNKLNKLNINLPNSRSD